MEHYDGEFYTLRLFSPIEGEIYSLNSTEEGIHLTAYEMENYSSFIRDHMEGVGLLGKRNQKLMTYFNNEIRLHKPVSLSLDLEAYEGRLWSVLQADSQDKLTHEEVQSLAETWGMIAAGGFIREMQETRILVPDGELMVFLGNEGLDYFVCPERDGTYIKTSPGCCHLFRSIFPRAELSRGEAEASSRTRFFEGCKDESLYS